MQYYTIQQKLFMFKVEVKILLLVVSKYKIVRIELIFYLCRKIFNLKMLEKHLLVNVRR